MMKKEYIIVVLEAGGLLFYETYIYNSSNVQWVMKNEKEK